MTTSVEFLPPRWIPPDDWIARLDEALRGRDDIVAAWFVTTRYPATEAFPEEDQEELHLELVHPPEVAAPAEWFRDLTEWFPWRRHGIDDDALGFTVSCPPEDCLARLRIVGARVWARGTSA
jgi:hypothetical protein